MGGGSAQVNPPHQVSVAQGLTALLGDAVTVTDGVEVRSRPVPARDGFLADPRTGAPGVRFTLVGADGSVLKERVSPTPTTLVGFDDELTEPVHELRFRAAVAAQGAIEVGALGVGSWQLQVDGQDLAFELAASGAGFGEEILAPPAGVRQVLVGPSATLDGTVTLPRRVPADDAHDGQEAAIPAPGMFGMFGLIARTAPRDVGAVIAEAVAAATAAQVAVVVVGLTEEQETEAVDKTTLHLPGAQDALVAAVAAVAPNTIVVINSATPVIMPWAGAVDAVLWAGLPGQEGGHAIAAVGYRGYFAGRAPAPAFWFGHGLGYSTWEYSAATLLPSGPVPAVSVAVTNTGARSSREVAQVYFEPAEPDQPVRLVGWQAVTVAPGDTAALEIAMDDRLQRRWDTAARRWDRLTGQGRLLVARGLGDIRATIELG